MRKILGIDTGGTYTDGVIINAATKEVLSKTKTLTTRRNLQLCINNCIHAFTPEELEGISLVCLSTTLATNAIVEGRGCKEGLILIGGRPEGKMPTERYQIVRGRLDIRGRMTENIDSSEIDKAIESFRGQVEAIAISGYASVRNPTHEIFIKERIQEVLDIPVVCAHDLTASLGFYERTVTATLNARLIPLICELIDAVKKVLNGYQIRAPLMIVKGDGTLMTEECARDKPIETILSGPAASVIGGIFLSGEKDAIILDMGGTTTDLANVSNGGVRMNNDGAKVGGWFTRIRAAEIFTVGLGGDSRIFLDGNQKIHIGPQKVVPFCMAGKWFPSLLEELQSIYDCDKKPYLHFWRNESEAFMVTQYVDKGIEYGETEQFILKSIEHNPHTLYWLQEHINSSNLISTLENLVSSGLIGRIALTPTDILHAKGSYTYWNKEISILCLNIISNQLQISFSECVRQICSTTYKLINCACIQSSFYYDHQEFDVNSSHAADYFVNHIFLNEESTLLGAHYFLKKPVVAIGAPAQSWINNIGDSLNTQVIIPENAEVANAVGAAVGQAIEQVEILIRPDPITNTYTIFSALDRCSFPTLELATAHAKKLGVIQATTYLRDEEHDIAYKIDDVYVDDHFFEIRHFIERRVLITVATHFSINNDFTMKVKNSTN